MKSSRAIMTFALLALTAACGNTSAPEITSITKRYESSGGVFLVEERFHYLKPGQIDYIEERAGGQITNKTDYYYNSDYTVRQIEWRAYENNSVREKTTLAMGHTADGELESLYVVGGNFGAEIDYRDGLPSFVRARGTESGTISFYYDVDSNLSGLQGGGTLLDVNRDEQEITSVEVTHNGSYSAEDYDYDDGQLSQIRNDDSRWNLDYDDAGRIARITEVHYETGMRFITEYEYGDGEMRGVQPTPNVPNSFLFGMDGRPLQTVHLLTLDFWFLGD